MNKRRVKKMLLKIVLVFLIILSAYYICIVIDTHSIIKEIKQVEVGYKSDNKVYERFAPHNRTITYGIKRYFTWVWGNKGEIWLEYQVITHFSDDTVSKSSDSCSVIIEKENGEWKAVKIKWKP